MHGAINQNIIVNTVGVVILPCRLSDFHKHVDKFAFIPGYKQHSLSPEDPIGGNNVVDRSQGPTSHPCFEQLSTDGSALLFGHLPNGGREMQGAVEDL